MALKNNIKEGMLQFCNCIKEERVTNTKLSSKTVTYLAEDQWKFIPSTHFSYQKVQIVNEFYS